MVSDPRSVIFRGRRRPAARPTKKPDSSSRPRSANFGRNPRALADFLRVLQVGRPLCCSCGFAAWLAVSRFGALFRWKMSLASLPKPAENPKTATSTNRNASSDVKDENPQPAVISAGGIDPELRSVLLTLPGEIRALSARVSKTELQTAMLTSSAMTAPLPPAATPGEAKSTPLAQLRSARRPPGRAPTWFRPWRTGPCADSWGIGRRGCGVPGDSHHRRAGNQDFAARAEPGVNHP